MDAPECLQHSSRASQASRSERSRSLFSSLEWPESLHGRAERTEERTPVQFFSSYRVFFFKQKDSYYTKECIMLIQFYSYTHKYTTTPTVVVIKES